MMIHTILSSTALLLVLLWCVCVLWRSGRSLSAFVAVATLAVSSALEVCDLLALSNPAEVITWKRWALLAESLLPAVWLLYSLTHAREVGARSIPAAQRLLLACTLAFPAAAMLLPPDAFFYSPDFAAERVLFLSNAGFFFYVGLLGFIVISLINLEMTYGNASLLSRWKIKFDFIGAGSFLAVLVFYYSQGLLYRTINMSFVPVRSLVLVLALSMMLYSLLARGNGVKIAVSRSMAYKSVVLFVVGLYLVALGLLGEGLKYFGEANQRAMAVGFAFLTGICLLTLLLSETAKRKLKVFLHKNFYQSKYDYRTQWLQFTDRLAAARSADELVGAILSGYCELFAMGSGGLFVREGDGGTFRWVSGLGMEHPNLTLREDGPLLQSMVEQGWVVNLREDRPAAEAGQDRFFASAGILFLVPLFNAGTLEAIVALGRPVNKNEQYLYEDYDLMKTMGRQASSALMNLRLSEELASARELEVMGRISAFILHDLKNLVYTLSLTVENAHEHISDPEFQDDMLDTLSNTVTRMKVLISKLRSLPEKETLHREEADLLRLAEETAAAVMGGSGVTVAGVPVTAHVDREEIQKVLMNLIVNALESTEGRGSVTVEVGSGSGPFIRVTDGGCGIPEDFVRNHLFSPFKTTKKKGLGIGLYQCRQIVDAHGGRIEVESSVGRGSVFTVWLD